VTCSCREEKIGVLPTVKGTILMPTRQRPPRHAQFSLFQPPSHLPLWCDLPLSAREEAKALLVRVFLDAVHAQGRLGHRREAENE